jgi:ATP-dependent Clp protease ATP-binding subunit ClpA
MRNDHTTRYSSTLYLIWRLAELEARRLTCPVIEPLHLLLGLSKCVDLDLPSIVNHELSNRDGVLEECLREVRRLRNLFSAAGLNAAHFRHSLRRIPTKQDALVTRSGALHRSPAAREVFAEAEHYAKLREGVVYPVHLLLAVLCTEDAQRDRVLKEMGVNRERLHEVVVQAALGQGLPAAAAGNEVAGWN